jgi:iron complex outermembrane recepter protein
MKKKAWISGLAAMVVAAQVGAQPSATAPQRIEITGSSIKRIAVEGALPLQIISRTELDSQGIVNAEQLIATLSTNGNGLDNLASNADVVSGQARGNNGSTSANLRSQGANATLILLNGRRVASHGVNGGVIDLNQIPMAAVERVEVLKDGASSIYGTDAVGGVINFILRNNFEGLRASATADVPQMSGGKIYRASLAGGLGNLDTDGFNLLATLSVTDAKRLDGRQRDFVNTFQIDRGLSPDTRGTPYATLFMANTATSTIKNVLTRPGQTSNGVGPLYRGATLTNVNTLDLPGQAGCDSQPGMGPYAELLWNSAAAAPASQFGCAYDTGRAVVIQQPVKNTNLVTRGNFKIAGATVTAEYIFGRSESAKLFSENQISSASSVSTITLPNNTTTPNPFRNLAYPSTGAGYARVFSALTATFPELAVNNGLPMTFRWRCLACGQREYDTTTDTNRALLSVEGSLPFAADWDYRVGASRSMSKSKSMLGSGYHNYVGLANLINTGVLNPFLLNGEQQTPAAMAGLEAISARGTTLYGGEYSTTQVDAKVSGMLFSLPAGEVLAAVGLDFRQEKYKFAGNVNVNTTDINTWIFNAAFDNINALSGVKRDVKAVFGEVIVPVIKDLEVNLSARYDDYSGFGSTTNPKVSLRYAASEMLVFRGSYSTGFRVPTFNQLYNGITESPYTGAGVPDPFTCAANVVSNAPGCAAITFNTLFGGKPELQPEKSKMSNVGFVFQPINEFSATFDWWNVKRKGTIGTFDLTTLLRNYALFPQIFIRDQTGAIKQIDTRWVNAGETRTQGIEVSLRANTNMDGWRLGGGLDGTYLVEKKSRLLTSSDFGASEVGVFTRSSDLGIRWKHSAFVAARYGDWASTLRQQYIGGYLGYVPPGVANGNLSPVNYNPQVNPYRLYNANVAYMGVKNLVVNLGVKNLLNTDPPFALAYDTNTGAGSSWEPRVADPRGRSFVVSVDYKFF